MDDGSITMIAALAVLVALSAFFSASETAFSSLNQIRVKSRAEDGDPSAKRVLAMSQQYDKLLSTILIGNNIVNIASASLGTLLFTAHFGPEYGATLSTIVMTLVVLIFGEITPKSLAKEVPERLASAVAPALQLLMTVLTPLNWLFAQWKKLVGRGFHGGEADTITEGELMTMVNEFYANGCTKGDMKALITMLSPFAPHIAEELWEMLGYGSLGFACQQPWPEYDESKTVAAEVQMAVQVCGKLRATVTVPMDSDEATVVAAALADPKVQKFTEGKNLVKTILVPNKLVNLIAK